MPAGDKLSILIVEDDRDLAEMLNAYFSVQSYEVLTAAYGKDAIEQASESHPDLIVLDIHLPDITGFEVCNRLRESHRTRSIPIIFLTELTDKVDRMQGLELGVVDYITKPFDIQELRLRVRNTLRRATTAHLENPVTGLPEGDALTDVLEWVLDGHKEGNGLLAVTLRGLNAFRDLYGFVASDDVLRVTSLTLNNATMELGGEHAFCGHIDDSTFLMLAPADKLDELSARILERIGNTLEYFYPGDNRGENAHTDDRLRLMLGRLPLAGDIAATPDELTERLLDSREEVPSAS